MDHTLHDGENGDGSFELSDFTNVEPLLSEQAFPHESPHTMKLSWSSHGSRLLKRLEISSGPGKRTAQSTLVNHDLKPVEPEQRKWGAWNFVFFWIADSFNINTWMIASAMITGNGLSWWQAWVCVWIGYAIAACFVCFMGRIGAVYHISFPVVTRASFGIWGSLWPVFNRTFMACIWYGVQAWIGGQCVTLMIRAIWLSYSDAARRSSRDGITTEDFISFVIFWTASLPAIWFPVHKIRHLFTIKAYVVPTAGITLFAWALRRANGMGPIIHQPATAEGSELVWGIVSAIMSGIANFAAPVANNADFARFASKPSDAFWPQLLTIPTGFAFTSFIGMIVSSSSTVIFGTTIWNPLDLLSQILDDADPTTGSRFGVLLIASAFALAQLGTNIAANSVSAGTDMTALLPRYINIRRGGYVCAVIGLAICPWRFLSSSNNFATYLSAYSVFLSSIIGVIICDFYAVRKGHLKVKDLYKAHKSSPYYYWSGWNWRAYLAYGCGVMINIFGFMDALGVSGMPVAGVYVYRLNFFAGFGVSSVVYYVLCNYVEARSVQAYSAVQIDDCERA